MFGLDLSDLDRMFGPYQKFPVSCFEKFLRYRSRKCECGPGEMRECVLTAGHQWRSGEKSCDLLPASPGPGLARPDGGEWQEQDMREYKANPGDYYQLVDSLFS